MITIKQLVENGIKKLEAAGIDEADVHGELIAAFVLNKSRTYVRAFGQNIIFDKEELDFKNIQEDTSQVNWEEGTGKRTARSAGTGRGR
jgi:methylase of polypeptide subunit release factors